MPFWDNGPDCRGRSRSDWPKARPEGTTPVPNHFPARCSTLCPHYTSVLAFSSDAHLQTPRPNASLASITWNASFTLAFLLSALWLPLSFLAVSRDSFFCASFFHVLAPFASVSCNLQYRYTRGKVFFTAEHESSPILNLHRHFNITPPLPRCNEFFIVSLYLFSCSFLFALFLCLPLLGAQWTTFK